MRYNIFIVKRLEFYYKASIRFFLNKYFNYYFLVGIIWFLVRKNSIIKKINNVH